MVVGQKLFRSLLPPQSLDEVMGVVIDDDDDVDDGDELSRKAFTVGTTAIILISNSIIMMERQRL